MACFAILHVDFCLLALCPDPAAPANGEVNVTGHSIGNITVYTCNDGFGNETATCTHSQVA